ncbi:hypothetical protein F5Y03DRAFT_53145 [Xylaria venustula]|nr:hypothetical protein F5Y03DRAFT_53145 [Xylaria venustula]
MPIRLYHTTTIATIATYLFTAASATPGSRYLPRQAVCYYATLKPPSSGLLSGLLSRQVPPRMSPNIDDGSDSGGSVIQCPRVPVSRPMSSLLQATVPPVPCSAHR